MPIREITDEQLVRRAMMNARPTKIGKWPRFAAVMDTFGLGSTYSWELCEAHGLNPEDIVSGATCHACEELEGGCHECGKLRLEFDVVHACHRQD